MRADFQAAAEAVGTCIKRFTTIAEAISYIGGLAGGSSISCSWLPPEIREAFGETIFAAPEQFADSRVCVSWAEAGITATGSILLDLSGQHDRSATSLALIHAVFIKESTLVPDIYALKEIISQKLINSRISRLSITTGPSRTADIERVLTIGVHGPKELHLLVIEGEC